MKTIASNKLMENLIKWFKKNNIILLRISIGIIFFWFGFLKYFHGLSPAEKIAIRTIDDLTFHLLSEKIIIYGLATWEVMIGIGMLFNLFMKFTLLILLLHMLGTFTPLFLYTHEIFTVFPIALTLEGQYIIKNIVIIASAIVIAVYYYFNDNK